MKTKFVKVSVEEILPELKDDSVVIEFENGELAAVHREDWFADVTNGKDEKGNQLYTKWYLYGPHPQGKVLNWLEEVPDREAEMLEMLNEVLTSEYVTGRVLKEQIKKLIQEATTLK